jgi:hypothetical protein
MHKQMPAMSMQLKKVLRQRAVSSWLAFILAFAKNAAETVERSALK